MTVAVITADEAYLRWAPALVRGLADHAAELAGVAVVVPPATHPSAWREVASAAESAGVDLEVRSLVGLDDLDDATRFPVTDGLSPFSYARLALGPTLPDVDRVLYLDVDLLVRGSLADLIKWPLSRAAAMVPELTTQAERLFGDIRVPYLNSGVLLASLSRWRDDDLLGRSLSILGSQPGLRYMDQDVLNLLLRGDVDLLPITFNVADRWTAMAARIPVLRDPAIVHFSGPAKPWLPEYDSPYAREWRELHARVSPIRLQNPGASRAGLLAARTLASARHSAAGRALRGVLPTTVKDVVKSSVSRRARADGGLARGAMVGLQSNHKPGHR